MLSPSDLHDILSGRRRGPIARILRGALALAERPYGWAVWWRNRRFDRHPERVDRVDAAVVSVGNLTLGGTGKTPMVEWLARWFRAKGTRVAIVSRGYGAAAGAANDEARELEQRLTDVPHVQTPDRLAGAAMVIEEFETELILLDDAFQHRRIARDLDIVLIDATEPFGYGRLVPRGLLREPPGALGRAHVVGLSRADMIPPERREAIRLEVARRAPAALWIELRHAPRSLVDRRGREEPPSRFAPGPVAALCGIGNPAGFRHTLAECGFSLSGFREFPDHHRYDREDVARLEQWVATLDATAVLCTEKDLVKLDLDDLAGRPLRALRVALEITAGREEFERVLSQVLPGKSAA